MKIEIETLSFLRGRDKKTKKQQLQQPQQQHRQQQQIQTGS